MDNNWREPTPLGGRKGLVLASLGWLCSFPELRPSGVDTTRRHLPREYGGWRLVQLGSGATLAPRFCQTNPPGACFSGSRLGCDTQATAFQKLNCNPTSMELAS